MLKKSCFFKKKKKNLVVSMSQAIPVLGHAIKRVKNIYLAMNL